MLSVVPKIRRDFLRERAIEVRQKSLGGSVAEVGVYKGGSAKIIAEELPNRTLYLFDTFEGMPDIAIAADGHKAGDFSDTSLEAVEALLEPYHNILFYPGVFPTSARLLPDSTAFCLVHVDVDLYQSTLDACKFFYPRMVPGGLMVFDDYNSPKCKGTNLAVDKFFSNKPEFVHVSGPNRRCGTYVEKL